jgi:hypothetical protein
MGSWPLVVLFVVGALLLCGQGDSWRLVIAKLVAVTVAATVVVLVFGGLMVWWG